MPRNGGNNVQTLNFKRNFDAFLLHQAGHESFKRIFLT